jgi:hypothetical protein
MPDTFGGAPLADAAIGALTVFFANALLRRTMASEHHQ